MAIVDIKVVPVGTDESSFSSYVADAYRAIRTGNDSEPLLTAASTVVEADLEQCFELIRRAHQAPFARGAHRVITTVTIDDRRDKPMEMEAMVRSVLDDLKGG